MATLYTHQDSNIRKTWMLFAVFLVVVIAVGWGLAYYFQEPAILLIASIFAIVQSLTSYWFSHKIVVSMTGAKKADEVQYRELHEIVENLAITAGLPKPDVRIVSDPAPNAFATGRDPKHAVVAVTTGLLQILDRTELEGVIAHELSHIGNRDMLVSTMAVVLVGFISIAADLFLRGMIFGGNDRKGGGGITLIIGLAFAILAPISATLIQLAVSRKREYLADASGALLTRYPEGLASALEKINASSRPMARTSKATAHLFIANPFGGNTLKTLFATHPPAEKRIKRLREGAY